MRSRQVQRLIRFLFCSWGWHSLAHAAPSGSDAAQLEVLGEIRIEARIEELRDGGGRLLGALRDEVGQPISGTLVLVNPPGASLELIPCGARSREAAGSKQKLLVPPSGEICAEFQGDVAELHISAQAPHFLETEARIQKAAALSLPSPQFLNAPQTLDLLTAHSVEVVAGPVGKQLPSDTQLTLSLACPDAAPLMLARKPVLGLRMLRFEFALTADTEFGNCQLLASSSAPGFADSQTARNVLVRGKATVELVGTEMKDSVGFVEVSVHAGSRPAKDGIVQASSSGAYLASAPVKDGRATLEIKRSLSPLDLSVVYVSSFSSGNNLRIVIPARTINKSWTGLHLLALLLFSSWLAFHWLKPRTKRTHPIENILPPRAAGATIERKSTGPLQGAVGDAHTGQRLAKVTLRIEAVGPEATEALEETTSDEGGNFKFKTEVFSAGLFRLVATAPTYMTLVAQIQSSQLTVHLTQRRRALVENLVRWAKSRGSPWFTGSAPTPGGVEKTARENKQPTTEAWAAAVASAAYSPHGPSEIQVDQLKTPNSAALVAETRLEAVSTWAPVGPQVLESKPETPS